MVFIKKIQIKKSYNWSKHFIDLDFRVHNQSMEINQIDKIWFQNVGAKITNKLS